jgi:hypothetical protein
LLGVLNPIAVSLYPAIAVMVLFFSALFSLHFQWGENKLRVGAASVLRAQSVSPHGKGDTPIRLSFVCSAVVLDLAFSLSCTLSGISAQRPFLLFQIRLAIRL